MKTTKLLMVILGAMGLFASCDDANESKEPKRSPYTQISLPAEAVARVDDVNKAAFKMFGSTYALSLQDPDTDNPLISTHGAFNLLAMLANAQSEDARGPLVEFLWGKSDGIEGLNEFCKVMRENLPVLDRQAIYKEGNAIWCDPLLKLTSSFTSSLSDYFDVQYFDQRPTPASVNDWAKEYTQGLIPSHESENSDLGPIYLANANSLVAEWREKFNKDLTEEGQFHNMDDSWSTVKFMHGSMSASGFEDQNIQMANLSFGNRNFKMSVIMNNDGRPFTEFVESLTYEEVANMLKSDIGVNLYIDFPKLDLENTVPLTTVMDNLGFGDLHLDNLIKGGSDKQDVSMKQSVSIRIDEEGAKVASVSSSGLMMSAPSMGMKLDRPFLYFIRETSTGVILYMGAVTKL